MKADLSTLHKPDILILQRQSGPRRLTLFFAPDKSLLAACGSNALLNAVVTLALNTALRKNEIRTLRWSQIDFEKRMVTVGRSKTQAGTGRVIPLNQPAFDALVKWAGRLVDSNAEDYAFPACEAAGIERERPDRERIDPSRPIKS